MVASSNKRATTVATTATLGGLAAAVSLLNLTIPYPLVPFLRFDFAEIADVLSFFLMGPLAGVTTTLIHWFALNFTSPTVPVVGPSMKFAAVLSMLLGFGLAVHLQGWFRGSLNREGGPNLILLLAMGAVSRVLIMSFLTLILYSILLPGTYVPLARKSLSLFGITFTSDMQVIMATVILTGAFNAIHVITSLLPAYIVLATLFRSPRIVALRPWIFLGSTQQVNHAAQIHQPERVPE